MRISFDPDRSEVVKLHISSCPDARRDAELSTHLNP
jgi:hypothetical protein